MKALITATALLVLLTSSAMAAKKSSARGAYAQAGPAASVTPIDTMNGPNGQVIWGGRARAQDPDPFIRAGMSRGMGNMGGT